MLKRLADYTTDKLKRAFQFFPLGWLGGAKASGSPQSQAVFKEKMKQTLASQGQHIRFLPYADRYSEETDAIRKAYPVMLRDPYIKQALYTKVFGVASLDLQVHAASKSTRDKEVADFAKHCLQKCRGGTRRAIMNIAIPGAIFGYSVTEKVLRKPDGRGQFGQKITLDMLKSKDVNKLQLEGDQYGNITGVRDNRDNQFYHKSNFLIYTHMPLFESPTGMSDFRAAYRAYWLADTAWQLRAIGLERYGLPVLKATYASDAEQYALEQSLPNVRSQGWITVPQGALVEAMDIAGRGTTDFESAIRDLREEMVLAIAGAILQMLTTTGTAEMRGSADVQKGTFELLQWYLAQEAADVFNDQLFPDLVDLNYRGAEYPTCTFGGVSDGAMKDSITVDQFFLSSGLPLSKEELYEKYGRQQPLSEEDSVKGQQPQQPPMGGPGGGFPGMGQFSDDGEPIADVGSISRQLMAVQKTYASGSIPRSAAIANARIIKPDLDGESAAALFPMRQALPDGSAKFDESFAEKWITIGGKSDEGGKKKNGGKRVIIDDETGEIKGGAVPKSWRGKKVGEKETYAKAEKKETPKSEEKPAPPAKHPAASAYDKLYHSVERDDVTYADIDKQIAEMRKLTVAQLKQVAATTDPPLMLPSLNKEKILGEFQRRAKERKASHERVQFRPLNSEPAKVESSNPMVAGNKVRLHGAEYTYVGSNPDGTHKLKNAAGGEFDTDKGENPIPLDNNPVKKQKEPITTRSKFVKGEIDKLASTRKLAVREAENSLAEFAKKTGIKVPLGVSAFQAVSSATPRAIGVEGKKLLTRYRVAYANAAADTRLDQKHQENVHRRLVEAELAAGRVVPSEVLADYPDLIRRQTQSPPPAQFDDDLSPTKDTPSIYWPDIRQNASWDCGSAEIVAAGRYAGVAMPPVDYVARECGTSEVTGTTPGKIVRTLGTYGIDNTPKTRMGLGGLRSHVEAGTPVIVHVTQWNGEDHYIAIIGMNGGMVAYHDPSTGFGEIAEREFAKHWDGHDRFGLRYPQWGVAIHGRRGDGPTTAKFDDDNPGNIVAPGPHQDTDNAIRLSQAAQKHGVDVVAKITEEALMRLARLRMPLQAASLYTPEERQQLADALASTLSTADLLGRARTRIRAEQVARSGGMFKFSEPTSFQRFDDDRKPDAAVVAALPPSRALDYFKSLVPTIQVSPDYANTMATRAFTLAGVTETNILERVKAIIQNRLESGQAFRAAPGDIQRVLDDAGISVRNPQYPEMVFRTNMIQSYNRGSIDAMRDPDVVDLFPVWQYHGIRDGRQRLEHQAHFGRFFPNSVDFETVRDHFYGGDPSPWNCRCTNSAVSKWEWKRLQEKGEKVSELGAYQMPVS